MLFDKNITPLFLIFNNKINFIYLIIHTKSVLDKGVIIIKEKSEIFS